MASWAGQPSVKGSSEMMHMFLLNFNAVGMTFTWGVEMTYCTPYLLSLGLTKGQTSIVWLAGPLSGLLVQPIIGVVADESKSKWGRRRPIIILASILVAMNMLLLGFTHEIVHFFVADRPAAKPLTIGLAVLSLYATDFAINAVMSCSRSLVVDTLPVHKQQAGAAWATRMGSLGHIIGYAMGSVDLVSLFGTFLGDTQFKQLTIIAGLGIVGTSCVTCWAVTERVLVSSPPRRHHGRFRIFRQIWSSLLTLPPRVRYICWVVFWTWIAWYPFHVYSSTWVGETYFRFDVPADVRTSKDALGDMGRIGSTAMAIYSMVNFVVAWLLPPLVRSPDDQAFTRRPPRRIAKLASTLAHWKPDLLTAWGASHLFFAGAMFLAPFAASFRFAASLVALCGLPWTVAGWAPTTFLGIEVNQLSGAGPLPPPAGSVSYRRLSNEGRATGAIELLAQPPRDTLTLAHANGADTDTDDDADAEARLHRPTRLPAAPASATTGELSGIYFGILNIYCTVPQFISTFMTTIVFSVLEPGKSPELTADANPIEHHVTGGVNAIAVSMFIGGFSSLMAAWATRKLKV